MRALILVSILLSACDGAINAQTDRGGTGGGGGSSAMIEALPCDVAALVAARCATCHANPPSGGAPVSLLARAQFLSPSAVNPAQTYGQRSVARMQDPTSPMPPGAPPPASEVAAFAAWVNAGMPAGSCSDVDAGTFSSDPTCLSGRFEPRPTGGDAHGGSTMAPGLACIACHAGSDFAGQNPGGTMSRLDTINQFMGTVFAAPHEKDLCVPALPVAPTIEILDMAGALRGRISVPASGNFRGNVSGGMPTPYRARVVTASGSREMATAQTDGDCNSCHTVAGREGAPGRIWLP